APFPQGPIQGCEFGGPDPHGRQLGSIGQGTAYHEVAIGLDTAVVEYDFFLDLRHEVAQWVATSFLTIAVVGGPVDPSSADEIGRNGRIGRACGAGWVGLSESHACLKRLDIGAGSLADLRPEV